MKYLLDTNVCVLLIRQQSARVEAKWRSTNVSDTWLSVITVAELQYGAQKSRLPSKNLGTLARFLTPFNILEFDDEVSAAYGAIRVSLEAIGQPIGPFDFLIAAHAVRYGLTLVTNNVREFSRVPNLVIEDWTK